jgi:hypothetical protein
LIPDLTLLHNQGKSDGEYVSLGYFEKDDLKVRVRVRGG